MRNFLRVVFWIVSIYFFILVGILFTQKQSTSQPATVYTYYYQAKQDYDKKLYDKSEQELLKALKLNPQFYKAMLELGCVYAAKGEFIAAREWFLKANELSKKDPYNNSAALFNIGLMDIYERDVSDRTWQFLREAWQTKQISGEEFWPKDQTSPLHYVPLDDRKGFERNIQNTYPQQITDRHELLKSYSLKRQYKKILEDCQGYFLRNPNSHYAERILQWRAFANLQLKKYDLSLKDLKELEALENLSRKDQVWVKSTLFDLYIYKEDYLSALSLLTKLTKKYPKDFPQDWNRTQQAYIYEHMGNTAMEEKTYREILSHPRQHNDLDPVTTKLIEIVAARGDYLQAYELMRGQLSWGMLIKSIIGVVVVLGLGVFLIFVFSRLFFIKKLSFIQGSLLKLKDFWLLSAITGFVGFFIPVIFLSLNYYSTNFLGKMHVDPMILATITSDVFCLSLFMIWFKYRYGWNKDQLGLIPKGAWFDIALPFVIAFIVVSTSAIWVVFLSKLAGVHDIPQHPMEHYIANVFQNTNILSKVLLTFLLVLVTPVVEEFTYRVFFFHYIKVYTNTFWAVAFQSIIFALAHQTPLMIPHYILISVISSVMYIRLGSIYPSIMMHAFINLFSVMVQFLR